MIIRVDAVSAYQIQKYSKKWRHQDFHALARVEHRECRVNRVNVSDVDFLDHEEVRDNKVQLVDKGSLDDLEHMVERQFLVYQDHPEYADHPARQVILINNEKLNLKFTGAPGKNGNDGKPGSKGKLGRVGPSGVGGDGCPGI